MQSVVDEFNRSQDRIFVDLLSVSAHPPEDAARDGRGQPARPRGTHERRRRRVPPTRTRFFPSTTWRGEPTSWPERYIPAFWDMCTHRGHLWAVPTTAGDRGAALEQGPLREAGLRPGATASHQRRDRRLFAQAHPAQRGDRPSKWAFSAFGAGTLARSVGGYFFGGSLWDGATKFTLDSPDNDCGLRMGPGYEAKEYGVDGPAHVSLVVADGSDRRRTRS